MGAPLSAPPAARAEVCVTVTVYQAGQPTPSGPHCQPVLNEFPTTCDEPRAVVDGYGLVVEVCRPDA